MMELKEIQEKARCNWCLAALINDTREIKESNFIDTGRKFSDGSKAYAVYCNECIANEDRVKDPKSAINKNTAENIDLEFLSYEQQEQQQQQQPAAAVAAETKKSVKTTTIAEKITGSKDASATKASK